MLSFLGRPLPPAFELRTIVVPAGGERPYDGTEWRGALVVVERGEIELQARSGGCRRFARGEVLWMTGLPLRALRNRGREPAVLVAITRRRDALPAGRGRNSARIIMRAWHAWFHKWPDSQALLPTARAPCSA
jgi:hypothetical protein